MRSSDATASPAISSFLAVSVSTERSQQTCVSSLSEEPVGGEIVDGHRDHERPSDLPPGSADCLLAPSST